MLLTPSPVLVTSRKLVDPVMPTPGQAIRYTLFLSNTGSLTATTLTLTDHLPGTLVLVSGTLQADGGSLLVPSAKVIRWLGALTPCHELQLTYVLTATPSTPVGLPLTNTVRLTADGLAPSTRQAVVTYRHQVYMALLLHNAIAP